MMMLQQGRVLRDSMLPNRGGWSVSESILATGQATADNLPPSQTNSTSDDYTDMSWHAPTARFCIARPALRGGPYPPWAMNALGGMPPLIDPTVLCAGRVLARSALRLLTDDSARHAAWQEFQGRRDADPIPPLADYPPPIDLPWPDYVVTVRGRGWHIPF